LPLFVYFYPDIAVKMAREGGDIQEAIKIANTSHIYPKYCNEALRGIAIEMAKKEKNR
jgi:hypothetical protein